MTEQESDWTEGAWDADGRADTTPLMALRAQNLDYVWIYVNLEYTKVCCTSIDNADFHIGCNMAAGRSNGAVSGFRWWWKPAPPRPEPPKCKKAVYVDKAGS